MRMRVAVHGDVDVRQRATGALVQAVDLLEPVRRTASA